MTNDELDKLMADRVDFVVENSRAVGSATGGTTSDAALTAIAGILQSITIALTEIAKRMPQNPDMTPVWAGPDGKPEPILSRDNFKSPRFDSYDEAFGWAIRYMDISKYHCSFSGQDSKWFWEPKP